MFRDRRLRIAARVYEYDSVLSGNDGRTVGRASNAGRAGRVGRNRRRVTIGGIAGVAIGIGGHEA